MNSKATVTNGLPFEEYIKLEAEHSSGLKRALRSLAHYKAPPPPDKDGFRIGRAAHMAITDIDKFALDFVVWSDGRRYGKKWDQFTEANSDKTIITEPQFNQAMAMRKAVHGHKIAKKYLNDGAPEVTVTWRHGVYDVDCKARIDWLRDDTIIDIKTSKNPSPEGFGREVAQYHYHMQLAWYQSGMHMVTGKMLPCKIIAVENVEPYDVVVFDIPEEALHIGRELHMKALDKVVTGRITGKWPGAAPDEEVQLILPQWALPAVDDVRLTFGGDELFVAEEEVANG